MKHTKIIKPTISGQGTAQVMPQIGSYWNNYLIINVIFKRLGVEAGKDSLPFAIFVVQNKEKWIYENASALYVQIGSEKLKFSTPNKSFINGLTNFALAGWLYAFSSENNMVNFIFNLQEAIVPASK